MKSMKKIERIKTRVPGLDELIEGGIPIGSTLLVAGGTGTGKTIFVTQIVFNRLVEGDKVLFLSLECSGRDIIKHAGGLGLDLNKFIENDFQLLINTPLKPAIDLSELAGNIVEEVMNNGRNLIVIDSESKLIDLGYHPEEKDDGEPEVRNAVRQDMVRFTLELKKKLEGLNVTLILIGEADESGNTITKNGIAEYEADGVIILELSTLGASVSRVLSIRKMRDTKISLDAHPMEITGKGIVVKEA